MRYDNKVNNFADNKGQALIEFLFIFLVLIGFILFLIQLTLLGNVRFMANTACYAACRKYVVTYSKEQALRKAKEFLDPAFGTDMTVEGIKIFQNGKEISSAPAYGMPIELRLAVYYKIMPFPIVSRFFPERKGNSVMFASRCSMTME